MMAMLRSMCQFFTKLQTEVNELVSPLIMFRSSMVRPANINKSRPVSSAIVPKPDEQPHQKMEGVNIRKMLSVVSLKPSPKSKVLVNSSHQNAAKGSASSFYNSVPALIRSYSNGEKIRQFTVPVPKKGVSNDLLIITI